MNDTPEPIDLEALDLGPALDRARTATFAPNWRTVLAVDALVGVVVIVVGGLLQLWLAWLGWIVIGIGVVYVALVGRRFLQWRWLRQQAGLA